MSPELRDGNTLAVGNWREASNATGIGGDQASGAGDSGAVYVFSRSGTTWAQKAYVKASNSDATDLFGRAVSLSTDGNTLAVGAERENGNAMGVGGDQSDKNNNSKGAVYLY